MDRTAIFYSQPSYHYGAGSAFPVFSGSRRQRGGSLFGSLKSLVLPVVRDLGRTALRHAIGFADDVVSDMNQGRDLQSSLRSHGLQRLKSVGSEVLKSSRKRLAPGDEGEAPYSTPSSSSLSVSYVDNDASTKPPTSKKLARRRKSSAAAVDSQPTAALIKPAF